MHSSFGTFASGTPIMTQDEANILKALDQSIRREEVTNSLQPFLLEARKKFMLAPEVFFTWAVVPLSIFGDLPQEIQSSWIFVIRAGLPVEPHRHPNSHQRTMSLSGDGDLQIQDSGEWHAHPISSNLKAPLERRWVSVPPNVWHQAVVKEDWLVLSFHTVAAADVIEEDYSDSHSRRKYTDR
jgi:hypothetical protein